MGLREKLNALRREMERRASKRRPAAAFPQYRDDPLGFISDVLDASLTPQQVAVVEAMQRPPYRVLASSGHSVGKSFLGACLATWWHYCRYPGLCLTTAPTDRQVKDILWKEIRTLAYRAGLPDHWVGPRIPRMQTTPDHFAHGFTARDATRFQGQHSPGGLLIIFDEAEGIGPEFWMALKTMLDNNSRFVAFYNPTQSGSACHQKENEADEHGTFARVTLSCLEHPNVVAACAGLPQPIAGAITAEQLETMLLEDSTLLLPTDEPQPGDVELAGKRFRPGPIAEARCLGRRPRQAVMGVWSERLWEQMDANRREPDPRWPVVLGCDVGRYGDDKTVIFARKGLCLTHAEVYAKQPTTFVANRLKELCWSLKDEHNPEHKIPVLIDEGGVGGGVIDQGGLHNFLAVNASGTPHRDDRYFNIRAELVFHARDVGAELDISRVHPTVRQRLQQELLFFKYVVRNDGRVQVTPKDAMKEEMGRSPDVADAFNLCLYPPPASR